MSLLVISPSNDMADLLSYHLKEHPAQVEHVTCMQRALKNLRMHGQERYQCVYFNPMDFQNQKNEMLTLIQHTRSQHIPVVLALSHHFMGGGFFQDQFGLQQGTHYSSHIHLTKNDFKEISNILLFYLQPTSPQSSQSERIAS